MSVISNQIDSIIMQRKAKAQTLRIRHEKMAQLQSVLFTCGQFYDRAVGLEDPDLREKYEDLFAGVEIPMEAMDLLDQIMNRLELGISRFERETLNVATVGRARQGKSTFLQAVGNLGNDIIPAFDAGDCTGAVSVIRNDPSMEPGEVRVDLTFRTQAELLEIVRGYINNIYPAYLDKFPLTYERIAQISIPALEKQIDKGDAGRTIQLEHLRRIVEDFKGTSNSRSEPIRKLCGQSGRSLSDPNEIRKYVAQNNGRSIDDPGRENYFSYLAVKQAAINCRFSDDVGKLVLVDTIGLGDTQFGIEEAMLDTVDSQCDAAIVVTKPDSGIKDQDQRLYELLRDRFKQRDTSMWLFYLANLQPGYNSNAVDTFVNNVRERNFAMAGCTKINCMDKESVRGDFLIPMLNTLLANMERIDAAYIGEIDQMCARLKEELRQAIEAMPRAEGASSANIWNIEATKLGVECYRRLTSDLKQQVFYWYNQRNQPNAVLWNRVTDILDNLESLLPSAEGLQRVLDESGTLMGENLWETPLNYVRNEITDQFIAIDKPMEQEVLKFKNSIVRELYESLKTLAGQVGAAREENTDHTRWLWGVMEPMLRDKPQYNQIYRAFQFLDQFEFNVRAQLIQEVRTQLRIINQMTPEYYMKPNYTFRQENIGQSVHFYLTSRLAILEDGLRHNLALMNKLPNRAFYAAAEEFYDRLTFASDFKNGTFVEMSVVWGEFFAEFSHLIWAAEKDRNKPAEEIITAYEQYRAQLTAMLSALG